MYMHKLTSQVICNYDDPVVQVEGGKLRGLKIDSTYIFRGIQYAETKRFQKPEKVKPWEGIKDAISYGYVCPEPNTAIAIDQYQVPHFYYPQDEDCTNLNIWTQSLDSDAKRPVIVWIHGGGWNTGSSVEIYSYDGENISEYGDIVFVSINHRLNFLGYMDMSAYGEKFADSHVAGLQDLVMALQWVHDNIASFGGDPANVTIMGQSGGGDKVNSILQTPAADGLYCKAIMDSNGSLDISRLNNLPTHETMQPVAARVLEYLNISPEEAEKIVDVSYYDLADAVGKVIWEHKQKYGTRIDWRPICDGKYFLGNPLIHGFRQETADIPMIVGNCLGESANNYYVKFGGGLKNTWSEEHTRELMQERFGELAESIEEAYREAYPNRCLADSLFIEKTHRIGAIHFTKERAKLGKGKVWNWLFALEMPFYGGTTAWHNSEEPYMFHNAQYIEAQYIPDVSEKMQDIMASAIISFARYGDPNHDGMPIWEPSEKDCVKTMIFDAECEVKENHDEKYINLLPGDMKRSFPDSHPYEHIFSVINEGINPCDVE